ncbi:hypothetical protein DX130_13225 [Paenibacillus paeoniae]|uniref:Uncharacterized protein n=2 Tax=Paenibacillus paeoniae TaxID=2292705 RepID=A0A371PFB1_9BACL|nr:hypothetical protein DX130_13225 [Paenibacillus paeoniae]
MLTFIFIIGCGSKVEYDSAIHDERIKEFIETAKIVSYLTKDPIDNDFAISILKKDKEEITEYAKGKMYMYTVSINVTSDFFKLPKAQIYDLIDEAAIIFGKTLADNDGEFRGMYSKIFVSESNFDENGIIKSGDDILKSKGHIMNIQGIRKIDGQSKKDFSVKFYDKNNNPVYDK